GQFEAEKGDQARRESFQKIANDAASKETALLFMAVSLHDGIVDGDDIEQMARQVKSDLTRSDIDEFLSKLIDAKLLCDLGVSQYVQHPVLIQSVTTFVDGVSPTETRDTWERAFLDCMTQLALEVVKWEIGEQVYFHSCHGPNFQ